MQTKTKERKDIRQQAEERVKDSTSSGKEHLDWALYQKLAKRFAYMLPDEERQDFSQDIIVALADKQILSNEKLGFGKLFSTIGHVYQEHERERARQPKVMLDMNATLFELGLTSKQDYYAQSRLSEFIPDENDAVANLENQLDAHGELANIVKRLGEKRAMRLFKIAQKIVDYQEITPPNILSSKADPSSESERDFLKRMRRLLNLHK